MSYKDFGLDETKKAADAGTKGDSYCIWCHDKVELGFSLCFQNWVICKKCSLTATNVENNHRWKLGDTCFKCHQPDVIGFRTPENTMALYICKSCIDWSKQQFRNREKTILLTQRKETMTADEILLKCTVDGLMIRLPKIQLDLNTEYKPLKTKLEKLGAKWEGGRIDAFVFDSDPTHILEAVVNKNKIQTAETSEIPLEPINKEIITKPSGKPKIKQEQFSLFEI